MNTFRSHAPVQLLAVLLALLLAGCGGSAATVSPTAAPAGYPLEADQFAVAPSAPPMEIPIVAAQPTAAPAAEAPTATPAATAAPAAAGGQATGAPPVAPNDPSRKIIKDATLTLEVNSVDLALSRISGAAAQVGGYVLETRTDQVGPDQKQAMLMKIKN